MANTIQIKRSSGSNAPAASDLKHGELAWVDHGTGGSNGCLYIGDMSAGVNGATRLIGGTGTSSFVTDILNNSALTGVPTAPTAATTTSTTQLATTAFVQQELLANTNPISQASDTDISGSQAPGAMLVWDGVDSWDDVGLTGDVSIAADGSTTVNSVAQNSVFLGTDTVGNYISTVSNVDNNLNIVTAGSEGASVQVDLSNNVTIAGNLTVNGTTTTVDSTTVTVADPIFTLGANAADSKDRGIIMRYGAAAKFSWMGMDDTDKKFKYIEDATNASDNEIIGGSLGDAAFGNIDGTLTTGSQIAITEIGTITTGVWNGDAVSTQFGGTGKDFSGSTGIMSLNNGDMTVSSEMPVTLGGTGLADITSGGILLGAGTSDMTVLTVGAAGQMLKVNSGATAPEWSDVMDGGTF